MNDDFVKLMALAMENAEYLDQMVTLGIEYQTKNITAERFSQRICETLAAYQRRQREFGEVEK